MDPVSPANAPSIAPPQSIPPVPLSSPRKSNTLIWILLAVFLFGTGFSAAKVLPDNLTSLIPSQATPTPTQLPQPTPTPDPTANWRIYSNTSIGIEFKYPMTDGGRNPLEVYTTETNPNVVALLRPKSSELYSELFFDVARLQNTQVNDWYMKAYQTTPQSALNSQELENGPIIGGIQSKQSVFNTMNAKSALHIFIQKGRDLYQIVIPSTNNATQIQILSTFKFTDTGDSQVYTCPGKYVNCMPIVIPERQWMCEDAFLNWAKQNCPDFEGTVY